VEIGNDQAASVDYETTPEVLTRVAARPDVHHDRVHAFDDARHINDESDVAGCIGHSRLVLIGGPFNPRIRRLAGSGAGRCLPTTGCRRRNAIQEKQAEYN
jgi:hypothetical protein